MSKLLIHNGFVVNEGIVKKSSVFVENSRIIKIESDVDFEKYPNYEIIDANDKYVIPGIIDTHVHFREPGLTEKANIFSESRAAAAGGITTFFDMPNTIPQTINNTTLEEKFSVAQEKSLINYSFYVGATNDNLNYLLSLEKENVAGIKLFYASSTGNMLVNKKQIIEQLFKKIKLPIVVHSEKNEIINQNLQIYKQKFGEDIPIKKHEDIRSVESCIVATKELVNIAQKYNTKLHFLHITTADEVELLKNVKNENITSEVSPNHLFFDSSDYQTLGNLIKCNPSIKSEKHKKALLNGLKNGSINTVATDHAPHLIEQKQNKYLKAPSGIPSIQHSLNIMLEFVKNGDLSIDEVVEKMCHNPAKIFKIKNRGFIKKGYFADIVILDLNAKTEVLKQNLLYKCNWSPLEGTVFDSKVVSTIVNGKFVYNNNEIVENKKAMRVEFER
ncbi:MAG: dihydroorotase [Bacteroidota bacterium]|nr:dihydroorotase [Bacteroidota bacterium]